MAKSKPKYRKSEYKDKSEPAPKGTARRTLSKALFFLEKADHSERSYDLVYDLAYECYVEAALLFARMVLGHLRNEFSFLKKRKKKDRHEEFTNWIDSREQNPLIKDLIDKRDTISHDRSTIVLSDDDRDTLYGPLKEMHEKLPNQLVELEDIVSEGEERFGRIR